ncbi:MAG TPA: DMT family transporter, partial [Candidatus Kapabacteria bacterium]
MNARRGSLAVLAAALLWSTGGLFIKEVSLDAWGVSFWRSMFAAVTLFAVYLVWKNKNSNTHASISPDKDTPSFSSPDKNIPSFSSPDKNIPSFSRRGQGVVNPWLSPFVLASGLCYALLLVLFVIATKLTTSANAIFLQYTAPIYVLFLEPMISRIKMRRSDLVTVAISLVAMAMFFVGKFEPRGVWGNIAALASGVAFAGYALILKHERATVENRWQMVIVGHIIICLSMAVLA